MNNSYFSNKNKIIIVLFTDNTVIIDGISHKITNMNINTRDISRFSCNKLDIKISRNILSIMNTETGSLETFNKIVENHEIISPRWVDYIIYKGNIVSINSERSVIKLNDKEHKIYETKDRGVYTDYKCSSGVLSLSKSPHRRDQWCGLVISRLE